MQEYTNAVKQKIVSNTKFIEAKNVMLWANFTIFTL